MENFGNPVTGYTTEYYQKLIEIQGRSFRFNKYTFGDSQLNIKYSKGFSNDSRISQFHNIRSSRDNSSICETKKIKSNLKTNGKSMEPTFSIKNLSQSALRYKKRRTGLTKKFFS